MGTNLGDLLAKAGLKGSGKPEPEPEEVAPASEAVSYAPKVVVRMMRKGRGGKTVTLVQGVSSGRDEVLQQLKQELGVGARVEEEDLVLQGDQVERVARWLESRGVGKVVRG